MVKTFAHRFGPLRGAPPTRRSKQEQRMNNSITNDLPGHRLTDSITSELPTMSPSHDAETNMFASRFSPSWHSTSASSSTSLTTSAAAPLLTSSHWPVRSTSPEGLSIKSGSSIVKRKGVSSSVQLKMEAALKRVQGKHGSADRKDAPPLNISTRGNKQVALATAANDEAMGIAQEAYTRGEEQR